MRSAYYSLFITEIQGNLLALFLLFIALNCSKHFLKTVMHYKSIYQFAFLLQIVPFFLLPSISAEEQFCHRLRWLLDKGVWINTSPCACALGPCKLHNQWEYVLVSAQERQGPVGIQTTAVKTLQGLEPLRKGWECRSCSDWRRGGSIEIYVILQCLLGSYKREGEQHFIQW